MTIDVLGLDADDTLWHSEDGFHYVEQRFAELVGSEIGFAASTYQQLFAAIKAVPGVDAGYLDYLAARYFP